MKIYPRIRKTKLNPVTNLRLHRAEFGHDRGKKIVNKYSYYPDIESLYKYISKINNLNSKNILVGAGGEVIIKDVFILLSKILKKRNMFIFEPNYAMYKHYSKIFNFRLISKILRPGEKYDLSKLKSFLKRKKIGVITLVNPSHPIEQFYNKEEIYKLVQFCQRENIYIILDEVYKFNFEKNNHIYKKFSNVFCIRSFSKIFGLPGLRVGYAVASKRNIQLLENFRLSIELGADSIDFFNNEKKVKKILKQNFEKVQKAKVFAKKSFSKRKIRSFNEYVNSITFDCLNEKKALQVHKYLLMKKIFLVNFKDKFLKRFLNVTTTNVSNLKYFFKILDRII